jgi:glycosyltransferase involved in cell wall biosynthesis
MSEGLVMLADVDLRQADATRIHTLEVARGFAAEGLEVDLIARGPDPELPGVRYAGGVGTDHQRIRRFASLYWHFLMVLWRRRRTARRLYVRYNWSVVPAELAGRMLGYHVVTQVDDMDYGRGYEVEIPLVADYIKRALTVAMVWLSHGIVAVTPQLRSLLVDQFRASPRRVVVLPNGVDIDFFHPIPREQAIARLGLDPALRYVVFCGHFAPWVDFDTILDGFAIVARHRPDARLLLMGDGSEREQIERRVRELGIEAAVIITGFIEDRATVRDYVAASVITLVANRLEHRARIGVSPVKLAEYMACARAVVATDLPGLGEALIDNRAGIVVPVDPRAMAVAILDLLDPERADELGANGRRLAEERFSWREIVRASLPSFAV